MKKQWEIFALAVLLVCSGMPYIHSATGEEIKKDAPVSGKNCRVTDGINADGKLTLTLDSVVKYVLSQNLDSKKAGIEYRASDIDLRKYRSLYDVNAYGKLSYSMSNNPPDSPNTILNGTENSRKSIETGILKYFSTGTSIYAGIESSYQNIKGARINTAPGYTFDLGGEGYQTVIKAGVSQELLKNFFGTDTRRSENIILNNAEMNRKIIKQRIAVLVAEAITASWNLVVAEENAGTCKINMESTQQIRDLVARKRLMGLSDEEEIMEWNSKVLQSKNLYELSRKELHDANLALLYLLNLDPGVKVNIDIAFRMEAPDVEYGHALSDALSKRADLINMRTLIRNSEMEKELAENNLLPSLRLNLEAGNIDYSSSSYSRTFDNINMQYYAGLEARCPIENSEARARLDEAKANYQKHLIDLSKLEKEISNETASCVNECTVAYNVYRQTGEAAEYQLKYYNQVLKKFGQGRYGSLQVKLALDDYIRLRLQGLRSLMDYNIALLRRDISRSVVFENLNIDPDKILRDAEQGESKKTGN